MRRHAWTAAGGDRWEVWRDEHGWTYQRGPDGTDLLTPGNLEMAAELLSLAERLERAEGGWISVEEQLPEESYRVLCWGSVETLGHHVGFFEDGTWLTWGSETAIRNVTHWRELPKGPA